MLAPQSQWFCNESKTLGILLYLLTNEHSGSREGDKLNSTDLTAFVGQSSNLGRKQAVCVCLFV